MATKIRWGLIILWTIIMLPLQCYCAENFFVLQSETYLGEFVKGRDKIRIQGQLLVMENNERVPIAGVFVELYANFSDGTWLFLGENKTDENGIFVFVVSVDNRFPAGEVILTVYYPGDILKGYEPARAYYRAIIKEPQQNNTNSLLGMSVAIILLIMMFSGATMTLMKLSKHAHRARPVTTWLEILDEIITKVSRREFNFIMLTGSLLDALCKYFGRIPRASMTLQEKLLMIKEYLSEEVYNILKNMISLYEIQLFGGPYARSILMNTLDYDVWKHLLEKIKEEFVSKWGK